MWNFLLFFQQISRILRHKALWFNLKCEKGDDWLGMWREISRIIAITEGKRRLSQQNKQTNKFWGRIAANLLQLNFTPARNWRTQKKNEAKSKWSFILNWNPIALSLKQSSKWFIRLLPARSWIEFRTDCEQIAKKINKSQITFPDYESQRCDRIFYFES